MNNHKLHKSIFSLGLILCGFTMQAQDLNKAKLDSLFNILEKNERYMGSIAISHHGKTIYTNAIGYDDIASKKKSTSDTKYKIGSISKMFTSVLIFKAVEEEKIQLNQTIDTYFPTVENANEITIGNLLNHRSGIFNFTNDPDYLNWNTNAKTKEELITIINKNKSVFGPNSKAEYSNSNYVLLTFILEDIYKKSFSELLKNRITEPLDIRSTYVGGKIDLANNECNSYSYAGEWKKQSETDMSIPLGAGAVISNPIDLNKFIEALFKGKLISEESLEQMTTLKDNYGMGIFQYPFHERKLFGHTGGIDGFSSILGYLPNEELAISLVSNGSNYDGNDIIIGALSCFFDKPYKLPTFSSFEVNKNDLENYVGYYGCHQLPLKIDVSTKNGILIIQATNQPPFSLEATAKNVFENRQIGAVLEFNPEENQFLLKQGGAEFVFTKE